jgi:hypothetical protein
MSKRPATPEETDRAMLKAEAFLHGGVLPVPYLGTTWQQRGAPYWRRRVGTVLLYVFLLAFVGTFATGFSIGLFDGGASTLSFVLTAAYVLTAIPGIVTGQRMIARSPLNFTRRRPGLVAANGVAAFIIAPFGTGVVLIFLLSMFGRDFIGERRARETSTPPSDHQGTTPASSKKPPLGPPSGSVAN